MMIQQEALSGAIRRFLPDADSRTIEQLSSDLSVAIESKALAMIGEKIVMERNKVFPRYRILG